MDNIGCCVCYNCKNWHFIFSWTICSFAFEAGTSMNSFWHFGVSNEYHLSTSSWNSNVWTWGVQVAQNYLHPCFLEKPNFVELMFSPHLSMRIVMISELCASCCSTWITFLELVGFNKTSMWRLLSTICSNLAGRLYEVLKKNEEQVFLDLTHILFILCHCVSPCRVQVTSAKFLWIPWWKKTTNETKYTS